MGVADSITVRSHYRSSKESRMHVWIIFIFFSLLICLFPFLFAPLPPILKLTFDFLQTALLFFLTLWYFPIEDRASKVQPREDVK